MTKSGTEVGLTRQNDTKVIKCNRLYMAVVVEKGKGKIRFN